MSAIRSPSESAITTQTPMALPSPDETGMWTDPRRVDRGPGTGRGTRRAAVSADVSAEVWSLFYESVLIKGRHLSSVAVQLRSRAIRAANCWHVGGLRPEGATAPRESGTVLQDRTMADGLAHAECCKLRDHDARG